MQLYQSVSVPSTCYILEIALWLAFGRVPEAMYDDESEESRDGRNAQETGETIQFHYCYSADEFKLMGINIDLDRYLNAIDLTYGRSKADIEDGFQRIVKIFSADGCSEEEKDFRHAKIREARAEAESDMENADWLAEVEAPFAPHVDGMKAVVFQALAQNRLKSTAWLEFTAGEKEELAKNEMGHPLPEPPEGRFVAVPNTAWTLSGFDWESSTLTSRRSVYRAVQCKWVDVTELFPTPQCDFSIKTLKIFPGVAIVDYRGASFPAESASQRRRGRPAKGREGVEIRRVVQNYFGPKIRKDNNELKREALIAEVMEFVKIAFDTPISRSTAQAYIAPLLKDLKANTCTAFQKAACLDTSIVPEIDADN